MSHLQRELRRKGLDSGFVVEGRRFCGPRTGFQAARTEQTPVVHRRVSVCPGGSNQQAKWDSKIYRLSRGMSSSDQGQSYLLLPSIFTLLLLIHHILHLSPLFCF